MFFQLQVLFFKVVMFFLLIGTRILNFRKPQLFTGAGSSLQLCDHIAGTGVTRLFVVTDKMLIQLGLLNPMLERLKQKGVTTVIYDGVEPNPTIAQIETGLAMLKRENCSAILAVGGGSSIDAAKAIGARATNPHSVRWMGGLFRLIFSPLTLYAVPTTAGTGSEVTIAAVVSDPENTRKFAIMDPRLIPTAASLDPQLMVGLPAHITAATGMDALTHAVEAYISRNHFPATDAEALEATRLIMQNLQKVVKDGKDLEGRANMALASFKAGVAFTSAGVGYVHAIAHNYGAYYHLPHGLANAIVMPYVLDYSKPECIDRLAKLAEVSGLKKGGESNEQLADAFIAKIRAMNEEFGIPTKVEKLKASDIPAIATAALKEAHWTYAVPRYMDKPTCESVVGKMLVA